VPRRAGLVGVPHVHDLLARLPFVARELERPEPTTSLICSSGGVEPRSRAGIMKGTLLDGLQGIEHGAEGSESSRVKVFLSTGAIFPCAP